MKSIIAVVLATPSLTVMIGRMGPKISSFITADSGETLVSATGSKTRPDSLLASSNGVAVAPWAIALSTKKCQRAVCSGSIGPVSISGLAN